MAWKKLVAHKITLGYLSLKYGIPIADLMKDPPISQLPFYDREASEDGLRRDLDKFAGAFTTYLANLDFELEAGTTLNSVDSDLLETALGKGSHVSQLGDAVKRHFRISDSPARKPGLYHLRPTWTTTSNRPDLSG